MRLFRPIDTIYFLSKCEEGVVLHFLWSDVVMVMTTVAMATKTMCVLNTQIQILKNVIQK